MTKITKTQILLDPELYKELGCPGRLGILRDGWDILLIPSTNKGQLVTTHDGIPHIQLPLKYQKCGLVKTGKFDSKLRLLFSTFTYEITEACMYYTDYREEQ